MKTFKYFKGTPDEGDKIYRRSNYLQSKDTNWLDRNAKPEDVRDDPEDDMREPIEEDIRD